MQESSDDLLRIGPGTKEVAYNPTVEQLYAPEVGVGACTCSLVETL